MEIICGLIGIYRTWTHAMKSGDLTTVSGHDYVLTDRDTNKEVLTCKRCGRISEAWFFGEI